MEDREMLIRLEQQLQNSIDNQASIIEDLDQMFIKIDNEAKSNASVKADLNTHIETENVINQNYDRRILLIEENQKNTFNLINKLEERLFNEISSIKNNILEKIKQETDILKAQIENDKKEINDLKFSLKEFTSILSFLKWCIGAIFVVISAIWPIVIFFLTK
jgi:hypothetical protein